MSPRVSGTIKFFHAAKGWGFIVGPHGVGDVFFHAQELPAGIQTLDNGQRVTFEILDGDRGPKAVDIRIAR